MNPFEPCPSRECKCGVTVTGEFSTFPPLFLFPHLLLPFVVSLDRRRKTINPGVQLRHGAPLTPDNGSVLVSSRLIAKLFLFSRCRVRVTSDYSSASSTSLLYHGGLVSNDRRVRIIRTIEHTRSCA